MQRLTREQAAVIGLYTGVWCGPWTDVFELADRLLGRVVWGHEFEYKEVRDKLKELVEDDFNAICAEE